MKFHINKPFNFNNSELIHFDEITNSKLSKGIVKDYDRLKAILKKDKMIETGKKVNEVNEAIDSLKLKLTVDKKFMDANNIHLMPNLLFDKICDLIDGQNSYQLFAAGYDKLAFAEIILNDKYLLDNESVCDYMHSLLKEVDHNKIELSIVSSNNEIDRTNEQLFDLDDSIFMSKMYYSYILVTKLRKSNKKETEFLKYVMNMISKYDECYYELLSSMDGFNFDEIYNQENTEAHLLQTKEIKLEDKATLEKLENELTPINDSTFVKQLAYMDENYLFLKDSESSYEDVKFKGKVKDDFSFNEIVNDSVYFNLIDSNELECKSLATSRCQYRNGIHFIKTDDLVKNSDFMKSPRIEYDLRSSSSAYLLICHKDDKNELINIYLKKYNTRELATPTFFEIETPAGFEQLSIIGVSVSKEITSNSFGNYNCEIKSKIQSIITNESKIKSDEKINNFFGIGQSDVYSDKELENLSMLKQSHVFYEEINVKYDSDQLFALLVYFNSIVNYKVKLLERDNFNDEDLPYVFSNVFSLISSSSSYEKQRLEFHDELIKEINRKKDKFNYVLQFVLINMFSSYFKLQVTNEEKLESPAFKQHLLSL